jgi:hypothetical protein
MIMPMQSEAQRRAMHAAAAGKSTLGIPKSVGKEFAGADQGGKLPKRAKRYQDGGAVDSSLPHDPPQALIDRTPVVTPSGGPAGPRATEATRNIASKSAERSEGPNISSRARDYRPPPKSAFAKGGPVAHCEGGPVQQFHNNLAETVANPTGPTKLEHGGPAKKASWRRW